MQNLLPPSLKCRQPGGNIWYSDVIPAYKVRPMGSGDEFVGLQLQIFAKRTRKHVVYDAQVVQGPFVRTGNFVCRPSCTRILFHGFVCAGRLDLKDCDFESFHELHISFFEDGKAWVSPVGSSDRSSPMIRVNVLRGYDLAKQKKDEGFAYMGMSVMFRECGRSLMQWLKEVNNVQKV